MKQFIYKGSIALIPVVLFFTFPFFVFYSARENASLATIIKKQNEDSRVLYGTTYSGDSNILYKYLLVTDRKAHVIALGNSRTLEFRKEFLRMKLSLLMRVSVYGTYKT